MGAWGCALKPSLAATPSRATILRLPAVVKGALRSDVNTNGDGGSWLRLSRRSAQSSTPLRGRTDGDPFLARLTWICPWRRCLLKSAKESAIKSVIERACYLYARHSWPCAAFLGNLQRSLQAFGFIIRTPCANWLVKDQQGKWNATFGWRVITFSVIDFAHEHRASEEHRDRPDLRRARGRRGPGGPDAISPSDVSPATTQ